MHVADHRLEELHARRIQVRPPSFGKSLSLPHEYENPQADLNRRRELQKVSDRQNFEENSGVFYLRLGLFDETPGGIPNSKALQKIGR